MRLHRPATAFLALLALLAPLALVASAITVEVVQDPPPVDRRQELMERFDTDGDGKLSDAEKTTMRESFRRDREAAAEKMAAREKRREQQKEAQGAEPPAGEKTAGEKPAPVRPTPEEQLARFDTDGDGKLSDAEKTAMRESFRRDREAWAAEKSTKPADGDRVPAEAGSSNPPARDSAAEGNRRAALLTRFDTDGDGKLSEEERVAYRLERDRPAAVATDPSDAPPARPEPEDEEAVRQPTGEELLARFDADGNGELSDAERGTLREAFRQEREEGARKRIEEQAERQAAPARNEEELATRQETQVPPTREEQLARFDTDGDGEIGDSEREAMREVFRAERAAAAEKIEQLKAQRAIAGEAADGAVVDSSAESSGRETVANKELPAVYRRYDRDGDGQLSPEESRAARQALIRGSDQEAKPADSLPEGARQFDLDGDGAIDEKERRAAVRTLRERRDAGVGSDRDEATLEPGVEAEVAQSRIDRARIAIAEELARRDKAGEFRKKRLEELSARRQDNYKKASLAAYSMLSKKGKKSYRPKGNAGGGQAGGPRQGVTRGKKRGSDYYRTKMQRGGRGGRRGGGQQYIR